MLVPVSLVLVAFALNRIYNQLLSDFGVSCVLVLYISLPLLRISCQPLEYDLSLFVIIHVLLPYSSVGTAIVLKSLRWVFLLHLLAKVLIVPHILLNVLILFPMSWSRS